MSTAGTTYGQHAVWFTEQAGVAGQAYHMGLGIWFDAGLDAAALATACAAVAARHPLLGCAVDGGGGSPRLVPAPVGPALTVVEVADDRFDERLRDELGRPFDLARGPLARFTLLAGPAGRHLLVCTAHHLVFDGMSKDVLVRDLAGAYAAALAGSGAAQAPVANGQTALAGSDAVVASGEAARDRLASAVAAERDQVAADLPAARAYWQRRWAGPGDPVLPELTRVPERAEPGAAVEFALPATLTEQLARTATELGVTRFELLLAALHLLMHRYGNQDCPIGVGLSTRTPATASEIGLFVNELPVRPPEVTGGFRGYARSVRTDLRALYRFRAVPFPQVVAGLRPAPALTSVSFGYRRRGAEPTFPGTATSVEWSLYSGSARNALHVQVVDAPSGITVSLQHSPAAIPTDAVHRIGGHLRTLLTAAVADPDRAVTELPILPEPELARVLRDWTGTARDWSGTVRQWTGATPADPAGVTVLALFAARVRQHPDATAVVDGGQSMTYTELDAASRQFAARLGRRGVGPGALVAVGLDRSWAAVVALLAVLRQGAAYLPVDPNQPAARQALVLSDAAPALVITTKTVADGLDPALPTLLLDEFAGPAELAGQQAGPGRGGDPAGPSPVGPGRGGDPAGSPPTGPPGPGDTAYLLYTSGSTGRPKGVPVPHRALTNLLLAMGEALASSADDRWLNLTSLSFDISVLEIFLPLVTGGRVVVASQVNAADGPAVRRLIEGEGVTHVQATPSGWRVLLAAGLDTPVVALAGGEALPVPLARELRARTRRLVNGYGPTEATIYATLAELPPEPAEVTIGRPIPNVRAYLLDDELRPVPVGVPGELYLGGVGLADGYLNQPALTRERFIPDPFGSPGERLYRTGDRCRWLPDGRIAFLGRADGQVKIRGHRVELGEIEARLLEHPEVAEAAVVLRGAVPAAGDEPDATAADIAGIAGIADEERLVGYVVPRGAAPEPPALRAYLARHLPAVMIPAAWVILDRLPLTATGKLDRRSLPPPPRLAAADTAPAPLAVSAALAAPTQSALGAAPAAVVEETDPVTEQIRTIWQDVLQVPDIGLDEDLFDLGGHSLTITRISGRIQQRLGVEVPLEVFFDTPTIADVAGFVRAALATGGDR